MCNKNSSIYLANISDHMVSKAIVPLHATKNYHFCNMGIVQYICHLYVYTSNSIWAALKIKSLRENHGTVIWWSFTFFCIFGHDFRLVAHICKLKVTWNRSIYSVCQCDYMNQLFQCWYSNSHNISRYVVLFSSLVMRRSRYCILIQIDENI